MLHETTHQIKTKTYLLFIIFILLILQSDCEEVVVVGLDEVNDRAALEDVGHIYNADLYLHTCISSIKRTSNTQN